MSSRKSRKTFNPGKKLDKYSIMRLIGQGGYGDIYQCIDLETREFYAIKVESISCKKQALKRELQVIRHLRSRFFPQYLCYAETHKYRYLIMELCGPSFSSLRKCIWDHRFHISTVIRMGIEMLKAIEKIHQLGFIHRDIKPSNFLLRASRRYPIALIDYGLSRPYIDPVTHTPIKPRPKPGFVGTTKYASLNAHEGKELNRVDDLFSWFYSLIEMWAGKLPWPPSSDKNEVYQHKLTADVSQFIKGMPKQMQNVHRLLTRMDPNEAPNYALIYSFMLDAMNDIGASWNDPYEWEQMDISEISPISLTPPLGERPKIPDNLPPPIMPSINIQSLLPNSRPDKRIERQLRIQAGLDTESSTSTLTSSTLNSTISTSTTISSSTTSSSNKPRKGYRSSRY